jgi:TRAP transporter TAXI family solute receptor
LVQSRIAVGSPGSSSALSAQRFFTRMGLWDHMTPVFLPTSVGMDELSRGRVEAVWALVGFPDRDIARKSENFPIRLLSLFDAAMTSGFFEKYPFYAAVRLDAGSYNGQEQDILTFQDGVLWMARPEVPMDYIYRALKLLYSANGRRTLALAVPVADELDPVLGRMGVRVPLHPGAQRYWLEFEERQRLAP